MGTCPGQYGNREFVNPVKVVLAANQFSRIKISMFGKVMEAKVQQPFASTMAKRCMMIHIYSCFTYLAGPITVG